MGILDPGLIGAVKRFEGFSAKPYWDYKQYTSGYGTRATGPNEVIDQGEAERRLTTALSGAQIQVDQTFPNLPPGVRNALISLTYNAGPGWMQSGLGDAIRNGDWTGAQSKFLQYNKAGGAMNEGLANRRATEASWFNDPGAPLPQAPSSLQAQQPQSIWNMIPMASSQAPGLPLFTPPDRQASEAAMSQYPAFLRGLT